MSCNDKRKFRTSEASTKASLRTKGAIDKFLNIIDYNKFNNLNNQWSKDAQERFDIKGKLFSEEDSKAIPNKEAFKKIDNSKGIFYQEDEMPISKSSAETLTIMKAAAQKMGIDFQSLEQYAKANPDINVKGVNGLADLIKGTIAVAQGMENVATTEEIVHMATAILEQTNPKLITQLISKIDRFKIYKQVLDTYSKRKEYQLSNGKPDIRKIKKEAVDKLIAELIVKQSEGSTEFPELMEEENRNMIQEWWNTILDYLRGVYGKSNIDIFETAAQQILTGEVDGTVADIKQGGIFFNLSDDVKKQIDDLYDKYIETDADLELNPETPTDKRHYTYKDVKVGQTVTEKVKAKFNKKFERTAAQKIEDDQKKEWGSEGHRFLEQHFLTNLIDKDGYKRKVAGTASISSTLSPEIQIQLRKFAKELVDSYPDGTRFLVEKKVVNTKVKDMLASTVDFKAIYPVTKRDGTQGLKVDTLDWKFTSINKTTEEDIPWFKQKEWVPQMGEYTQIDYNFGVKKDQIGKARMIPFIMNYDYALVNNKKSGLVPTGIEIGKLDSLTETNLYLLPVPTVAESTGNSGVDALVKSLRQHWEKLSRINITSIEQKIAREEQLNELSKAIRNLHIKLNFAPLQSVGETFLKTAKKSIDSFENIDYSTLSEDDIKQKLADLLEYAKSAEKFTNLDQVFLSQYPREGMTADNKKTLLELEHLSKSTERMLKKILQLQTEYAIQLGVKEGFQMPYSEDELGNKKLQAEAEISGWAKTWAEGTKLNARIIKLASNLLMNAKSLVNIKFKQSYTQFQELLAPLEEEARKQGKNAFDFIGKITPEGLKLIDKIDPKFWDQLDAAAENRDVDFFLRNINVNEYNRLAKEVIDKGLEVINDTTYSADEEEDARIKEFRASKLKDSLDINRDSFNGFNRYEFKKLVNQTLQEDKLYSKEFKELVKNKAAYDMWQYFTALNNKAKSLGYIQEKETSFFPLIEATIIQKFSKTKNFLNQAGESFWKDLYQTRINEEQNLSKLDPETGKVRKEVPKYFTKTDKDVSQLSTDLNKVGALWIKSLLEYEKSTSMESTMQTLLAVERAKGSLMKDQEGRVIFDEDGPKVNEAENRNAIVLETIIDDSLYNLNEDLGSIGNIGIGKVGEKLGKTEEDKAKKAVNIKKGLKNLDTLTRALAVGLKPLIAVANWAGGQFQSYINAGGMYRFREFEKNNAKIMMPLGKGLSIVERGLLDLIVPLNDDITTEEARNAAWEKGQYLKWLGTWTFSDAMMSSNSFPEKKLQFANAMSFNDNSMVVDGKIVNIRQFLKAQDRKSKYDLSESERKELEKTFEDRVKELQESSSLAKIAKVENDRTIIPGVTDEELAKYRTKVVEYGRKLNGQMNEDNKAGYRRDTIISSFMMFKTWIPKMVSERGMDITKNVELDEWEYGRVRLFFKTWNQLGTRNILKMREIINGTDEGLRILDEMLEAKKDDYYKKTGQVLEITSEEFYDLVRKELTNEMKELRLLLILGAMLFLAGAAKPPEEADDQTKNIYKGLAKGLHKISDEITFYYNPVSFEGMTKGSVLPSLNIITKAMRIFNAVGKEMEDPEKGHPMKYVFGLIPGLSQFQTEILPYINPELAKEMGIRVTPESRR
jgi:hypothetical protein